MSDLITLSKEDQTIAAGISKVGVSGMNSAYDISTVALCQELYTKAPEIAQIASMAIKDGLQGKALLAAKKIICGDEWNKPLTHQTSKKWKDFLQVLKTSSQQASYLLDFAGYKEVEEELIKEGIEITPIDTASHFREAKKLSDSKEHGAVATTYTEAVKSNNGVKPSTAKEVVEVVQKSKKKVDSEILFFKDEPQWSERKTGIGAFAVGNAMISHISPIEKDDWKRFYKTVAKCVHPDKGGSEDDMTILAAMNEMMSVLHKQQEFEQWQKNKLAAYKIWCLNYGCELHDFVVIEDESQ